MRPEASRPAIQPSSDTKVCNKKKKEKEKERVKKGTVNASLRDNKKKLTN
jgi:hypothetical protein